jgi:hypothetical protein
MIRYFDMGTCQPIGDESSVRPKIIDPILEAMAVPRLLSVTEAVEQERHYQPAGALLQTPVDRLLPDDD